MEAQTEVPKVSLKLQVEAIVKEHHEPTRAHLDYMQALFSASARLLTDRTMLDKLGMAFRSMAMTMQMHMEKEEQVLFPMFQRIEDGLNIEKFCGSIENPIHVMENEHEELDLHFARFRKITNEYHATPEMPEPLRELFEAFQDLEKDLKSHSEKEELILFPAALAKAQAISHKLQSSMG